MTEIPGHQKIPVDAFVMIIGAMKSGTSSLYSYLSEHPQICQCKTKEPEFFSENQNHGVDISQYEDLWEFKSEVHKYALEASTGYTKFPSEKNIPRKIFEYGLRPKFIYLIRNPIERIESHINFMKGMLDTRKDYVVNLEYMQNISNYCLQLKQFEKYYSMSDILVLEFTELTDSPQDCLNKVYEFLGLKKVNLSEKNAIFNQTRRVTKVDKLIRNRSKVKMLIGYTPRFLVRLIQRLLAKFFHREQLVKLTFEEKKMVKNNLLKEQLELSKKYQMDLTSWGK